MGYAKFRKNTYSFQVLSILDKYLFVLSGYAPPSLCIYKQTSPPRRLGATELLRRRHAGFDGGHPGGQQKTLEVRNIVMVADPRPETEKQRRHPETKSAVVCVDIFSKNSIWWNSSPHQFKEYVWYSLFFPTHHWTFANLRGKCECCLCFFFRKGFHKLTQQKG